MPYIKETFDVATIEQAKDKVLSFSGKNPEKFERETKFLVDVIEKQNIINRDSLVYDFGCGMGRVSKELINRFDCKVIGQDISSGMLMFAKLYTANMNKFEGTYDYSIPDTIDVAISILVLQHTENPKKDIDNIVKVLKPNGIFVLVNENKRFVPTGVDHEQYVIWSDDNFNIFEYVESKLTLINKVPYINNMMDVIFYRKES